jgi:O-antigen/teichoic acid export membrane protein
VTGGAQKTPMNVTTVIDGRLSALGALRLRAYVAIQSVLRGASVSRGHFAGFIALCDQGIVSVTTFATAVVVGRVCGKAELGVFTLAWTIVTVATGVLTTLISTPYTVFSPQMGKPRRRRYLGSLLVHQGLLSLFFALAVAGGGAVGSYLGLVSNELARLGATTAAVIVCISLREFIRNVSFAELKMGWALSIDFTSCLVQAAGILLLFRFEGLTARGTLTVIGLGSAVAACGWLAVCRGAFRSDRRLFAQHLKRNWGFAKWVLGSGLLWHCASYIFPWALAAFHGTSTTGIWAACSAIVALGNPVLLGLSNYVLPKISNVYAVAGIAKMNRDVHRSSLLFGALLLPLVLFLAIFGERILTSFYGSTYTGTASVLVLLAANLLVVTVAKPYAQGLFTLDCAKADTYVNAVWVCLLFAAGIPMAKSYATVGAAATMLATSTVAVAIKIMVFSWEFRRRSAIAGGMGTA